MQWHLGTMGFSYPEWGHPAFYPRGAKSSDYLTYYARCFDAVELDTTFYAAPDAERVQRWASQVPDHFRFSLKTPRDVTHADDVGATSRTFLSFLEPLSHFGDKLGMILLQFPPTFVASRWRELERLAKTIPSNVPLAAEFRHLSWYTAPGTPSFLADYHLTWASSDYTTPRGDYVVPPRLNVSTDTLYVRLIGYHDRYPEMNKEERDPSTDLENWRDSMAKAIERSELDSAQPERPAIRTAWVLFSNDYAGHAPATLDRFKKLIGQTPTRPLAVESTLFG